MIYNEESKEKVKKSFESLNDIFTMFFKEDSKYKNKYMLV